MNGGRAAATGALLWLAAAVISGFTMRRYLEPFDEGLLQQVSTRMADGQWPYRDFGWAYGPGQPAVIALAFKALGPSVIWWRVLRVIADATIALLVWLLVRHEADRRWALAAWVAAAVTIAQPTTANPFAPALAFGLGAVLAGARGRPAVAGLLGALAVCWRPDMGGAALAAAVVAAAWPSQEMAVEGPRLRAAVAVVLAGVVAGALLFAPFAAEAGLPRMWDSLVAEAARDGSWWGLPFPLEYAGRLRTWPPRAFAEDAKDALGFYLPLIGVTGAALAAAALATARRRPSPAAAGLIVLSAGSIVYLLSRPDELHIQPLLICLCALLPIAARGRARLLGGAVLGLVVLAGAANRVSALVLPPDLEPVHLAGVPGIRVPPREAEALPKLVARVQQLVPPGEPIYVAPRRSDLVTIGDPLIHFLVRRPNVLHRDVLIQARPTEQQAIVAALARARPRAIVRWTDPASSRPEPNRRGRPSGSTALDDYLAAHYRLDSRYGAYEVLVPR